MAENQAPATPRFDTVDVLRGVSILAVILLHTWLRFYLNGFKVNHEVPRWVYHLAFLNGGNGVTVFFAISGFLITYTSLRRFGSLPAVKPRVFYRIRFARIFPLLALIVAILSVLALAHTNGFAFERKNAPLWRAMLSAFTFHLNWLEAKYGYLPACWDVMWSLSVEEAFYAIFPLACLLLFRLRRAGTALAVTLLLAFVAAGPFARTIWNATDIEKEKSYLAGIASIALGCLTALVLNRLRDRRLPAAALLGLQVFGAALILLFFDYPRWLWIKPALKFLGASGTDDTLLALGACIVMFGSVLRGRPGTRFTAPLRWMGRHSYELYLTHEFVVICMVNRYLKLQVTHNPGPLLAWTVAIVLLCLPFAWLTARFFSEPLNRALRGARPALLNSKQTEVTP